MGGTGQGSHARRPAAQKTPVFGNFFGAVSPRLVFNLKQEANPHRGTWPSAGRLTGGSENSIPLARNPKVRKRCGNLDSVVWRA